MDLEILKIVSRQQIERNVWDNFVDSSDEAWLWHRYDLQDALSTWPGRRDLSFAIMDSELNSELLAIYPLQLFNGKIVHFFPHRTIESLGGVACCNGLGTRYKQKISRYAFDHAIKLAHKFKATEINVSLSPMSPAFRGDNSPRVNPLLEMGCKNTLTQSWIVNLKNDLETLWQNLEGRTRTSIRKAEKMGVQVRMADQPGDLDTYYALHRETYHRTGVTPHPKAYFEAIWSSFAGPGLALILFAEVDGKLVAAENFGVYKQAALYWTGAANSQGLICNANSLLQWTAMKWMVENGFLWYETGEAFPSIKKGKLKGLNDFKKGFGGKLYPFYKGRIITSRLTHLFDCYLALRGYE